MAMTKRTLTEEEQKIFDEFMAAYSDTKAAEVLDVNKSAVSFWRNGKTVPKATMILKMRQVLNGEIAEPEQKPEPIPKYVPPVVAQKLEREASAKDERTFCYIFRTFIANIDKGDFDSIKVKEAVDLARRLLNDKMVDGILVDRILRR